MGNTCCGLRLSGTPELTHHLGLLPVQAEETLGNMVIARGLAAHYWEQTCVCHFPNPSPRPGPQSRTQPLTQDMNFEPQSKHFWSREGLTHPEVFGYFCCQAQSCGKWFLRQMLSFLPTQPDVCEHV